MQVYIDESGKIKLNHHDSYSIPLIQLADVISGIAHNRYKTEQKHEYSL